MRHTLEDLTSSLREMGVDPDGYGERYDESREEHVQRALDQFDIALAVERDRRINWPEIEAQWAHEAEPERGR